ncbi:hypothetical protein DTO166G4_8703 [Paecilomyces variotii]|uniref:Uncharacterized protein n=1 Tax=Byssochlamys spectabilis TaxID=264951 RepID=A0A443HQ11_BYSSP|nr:hypothetical protein C8Q69DRAFT_308141 [Paecilomyces variotii]KAJ9193433.1 hypothetical protein DTO032I3_7811 [Paecilomyces variotii]KAJ9209713.1 hypothetical protein DTO166G4_8703 [Paecilomyces variotii]KAJ9228622.1 hypothetical protein DTO166G5_8459 [Paecilomyces variotii]KAJ9235088.1 hypothetical protein DTO169E5_6304 [Paecilomyces variotii]KAJ9250670.1 hypothetical protein DTO207G8_5855 [Paecilomyces variotii]
MGCFRQMFQCLVAPFQRKKEQPRALEIGPPTNFRKEESPVLFSDDDTLAPHDSHCDVAEKVSDSDAAGQQNSRRDMIKQHVRRLSTKITPPAPASS